MFKQKPCPDPSDTDAYIRWLAREANGARVLGHSRDSALAYVCKTMSVADDLVPTLKAAFDEIYPEGFTVHAWHSEFPRLGYSAAVSDGKVILTPPDEEYRARRYTPSLEARERELLAEFEQHKDAITSHLLAHFNKFKGE